MDSTASFSGGGDATDQMSSNGDNMMESVSHSSTVSGLKSIVSVIVKRKVDDCYLLRDYEGKGLWLPCTDVQNNETCTAAAQRLGFEVNSLVTVPILYVSCFELKKIHLPQCFVLCS